MITVKRTLDVGLCLCILTDEKIFNSISEDTATFESLKIDVINDTWLSIHTENEIIGCVQLKPKYNKCYESHIHILSEYRKEHSKDSGYKILEWCTEYLKGSLLYTEVPEFCNNVINYLKFFEFKTIGIMENAFFKNGRQNNMIIMTREV